MFTNKQGKEQCCCEFEVVDLTMRPIKVVVWGQALVDLTCNLQAKTSILFFTDIKAKIDSFIESVCLVSCMKTIVMVNPDIPNAHQLYKFAQSQPQDFTVASVLRVASSRSLPKVSVEAITSMYTLEDIAKSKPENGVLISVITL